MCIRDRCTHSAVEIRHLVWAARRPSPRSSDGECNLSHAPAATKHPRISPKRQNQHWPTGFATLASDLTTWIWSWAYKLLSDGHCAVSVPQNASIVCVVIGALIHSKMAAWVTTKWSLEFPWITTKRVAHLYIYLPNTLAAFLLYKMSGHGACHLVAASFWGSYMGARGVLFSEQIEVEDNLVVSNI